MRFIYVWDEYQKLEGSLYYKGQGEAFSWIRVNSMNVILIDLNYNSLLNQSHDIYILKTIDIKLYIFIYYYILTIINK